MILKRYYFISHSDYKIVCDISVFCMQVTEQCMHCKDQVPVSDLRKHIKVCRWKWLVMGRSVHVYLYFCTPEYTL